MFNLTKFSFAFYQLKLPKGLMHPQNTGQSEFIKVGRKKSCMVVLHNDCEESTYPKLPDRVLVEDGVDSWFTSNSEFSNVNLLATLHRILFHF